MLWLFAVILAVRTLNALSIRTFFQADEYYQSLEPAYFVVFKHGVLTWEWAYHLRSCIHPLIFAAVYKVCDALALGDTAVRIGPKLVQAAVSSVGEYYMALLALKVTRRYRIALTTAFLSLASPFNWFFITRTFSNNLEMVLTVVALQFFPLAGTKVGNWNRYVVSMVLAAVSCIIRPSGAVGWAFLGADLLWRSPDRVKVAAVTVATAAVVLALNAVADRAFYGEWTFPVLNFLRFNALSSSADFYGINSLSFYLVQGIPVIMTTYLPLMAVGICTVWKMRDPVLRKLLYVALINVSVFSLVSHKEFRFIYPMMPVFMIVSAHGYSKLGKLKKLVVPVALALNVSIALYMTRVHERGVIDVVDFLRQDVHAGNSIGFLTPCHSTPLQSFFNLGPEVEIWSLSCEPPLDGQVLATYMDESDFFYADPVAFMQHDFADLYGHEWPDYLVIFEALPLEAQDYIIRQKHYKPLKRFFNTRAHWDHRRNGDVIVLLKE